MPQVIIQKKAKTATQSGRAKSKKWHIVFHAEKPDFKDSLMGWTGAQDTWDELDLVFETLESAVHFATTQGYEYTIMPPQSSNIPPKNYSDNFRPDRLRNNK